MPYNSVISRNDAAALIPEEVSKEIIQELPKASTIMKLGKRAPDMARNQTRLPVLSALPTAYFVAGSTSAAGGLKQTTLAEWANKYFNAEEIACIVPIPEAVLDDADYDIWGEVKPLIAEAMGVVFDAAVMHGTNAPAAWPTDLVAAAIAAANTVTIGTVGTDLYDDLLSEGGVISKVEDDGFMVTGNIAAVSFKAKLRGVRDDNQQPIFKRSMQDGTRYELDGAPIEFPLNGAFDDTLVHLITGDFTKLLYTMRQDMTWKILTEAVIQDAQGAIVYNLAQQDMVALRCVMRIAWQVPNPINRMQQVEASRYPFGVLVPAA